MKAEDFAVHLMAGAKYGQEAVCGEKIDHISEQSATMAAESLSKKRGKPKEAYPCVWCGGWHVGRTMTTEEREPLLTDARRLLHGVRGRKLT